MLPRLGSLVITAVTLAVLPSHAATVTYEGSGTLSANASWDTGVRPITTDEALFTGTLGGTVTTAAGANLEFGNFIWDSNSSSTVALNTTGSSATQLRLTNGGGSTAAIANGGATGDLLVLGTNATSNTLTISGNLGAGTAQLEVFLQSNGNINVVNSGATLDIDTRLRDREGSFGFTKTGAGTLILRGSNTYTGTTILQEGTLGLRNSNALSSGALTINGGTLASIVSPRTISNNVTVGGDFTLGGSSAALTLNGTMDLGGAVRSITLDNSATIGGIISNGGLTTLGNATLTLSAENTYTGDTTVTAGTLVIGASGSLANTTTTIGVNGALVGGGTIGGATTIQGIHSPGFSPGTQTFTNDLSYAATATLAWDLIDNTTGGRGSNYDAVDVSGGSFTLATDATIDLSFGGSVDFLDDFWGTNQEWLVVALSGSATAADSNLFGIGTISGGANWDPLLGSFGIQRKDGPTTEDSVYLTWTAIPEPSTALLGSLGMLLLLRRRVTR